MDRKILQNTSTIFIAQAVVKIISFGYTIFLARFLGVEAFGFYIAAVAYFSLISSIADFGFNRFIIREGAKDEKSLNRLLGATVSLRIFLNLLIFVVFSFLISQFDDNFIRVTLSIWAVLAVLPQSIALTFDAALVSREKFRFSALGLLGLSFATVILGGIFVIYGFGVLGVLIALFLAEVFYSIILGISLLVNKINFTTYLSYDDFKKILAGSLPYGILMVLGLLYFRIDSLMLSYMKGEYETGIYGAGFRFLEAAVFIPSALATALFPVLARLDEDFSQTKKIYFSALKLLGLLSLPITLLYFFVLPLLIPYLLPQYSDSVNVIKILSFTIPFMFLHVPAALVLQASSKYLKPMIYFSFFTLGFNIVLNLFLIPEYGFIGAAVATVASEALSFIIFFGLIYSKILRR